MLDIGWWELIVVGVVALIVVGPGELPALLRTIGRYVGMAKRQADEFRSQFDDALRDSEFNDLRDEMNEIKSGVTSTLDDAQDDINKGLRDASEDYDWDKDGKIEPAPEFAEDKPTTEFTMSDGTVVKKNGAGEAAAPEPAGDANDLPDVTQTAANDAAPAEAPETTDTNPAHSSDTEAVR